MARTTQKRGRRPGVRSVSEEKEVITRSVALPRETWEELDALAEKERISRSELFRNIIQAWRDKMSEAIKTITTQDMTQDEQERFVVGWEEAGGYMDDADSPRPWCMPWIYESEIEVAGTTPEEWGASWWQKNRQEIEELLEQEEEARQMEDEDE